MFLDARKIPDGETLETDLCIVGGGAAGITLARQFIDQPFRVCLLESGGLTADRETQRLYEGVSVGLPYELDTTRTRFFGGSTNCWGGFCRPFEDYHFRVRDWVPESGWPISAADLRSYYDRAHEVCGLDPTFYDPAQVLAGDGDGLRALPLDPDRLQTSITQLTKLRRCFGKAFRDDLAAAGNVSVCLHANAVELETAADGNSIEGVRIATFSGRRFRVRATLFVLATGAIENARLLLASNAVEAAGVGNRHDTVGRWFMEHPRHSVAEIASADALAAPTKAYLPRYAMLRLPFAAEMNVPWATQQEERLLDAAAYVELVLQGEESASTLAVKQLYWDLWRGGMPRAPMRRLADILSAPLDLLRFGWGVLSCSERFVRCRRITLITEQAPNPESRVMLASERDALGMPRVALDWRLTELDHRSRRRTSEIVAEGLRAAGLPSRPRDDTTAGGDPLAPSWNWHHMGTTRMHVDPKRGVVDPQCRVHGLGNLFVAGSSVFPTAGNHTPTLTIIALALRLGDHLRCTLARRSIREVGARATGSTSAPVGRLAAPAARPTA